MIRAKQLAAVLGAISLVAGAVEGADLLRNSEFREQDDAGRPVGWHVTDDGQCVAVDAPVGVLRVDIAKAREFDGQIGQRLEGLPAGRAHVLSGRLRSTKPGIGYLQVKLHRGRREQQRLTAPQRSEAAWRDAELTFSIGDADAVEVLCRFRQRDDTLGQTVWFSSLRLREAESPRLVRGEAVPTFESIGICVDFSGGLGSKTAGRVRYRPEGSATWREGLNLVPCVAERQLRGSLFGLTPDTAYEIECHLVDPAVKADAPLVLHARTWREDVPIAETRALPAPESGGMVKIDAQGKPDGWSLYRPAGSGPAGTDAGPKGEHALLIANAAYVIVEGFELRGGRRDAVRVAKSHHVRIRHCDIAGWGDPGTAKDGLEYGRFVDASGRVINYQAGVHFCDGSSQVVVEHCFIHAPRGTANSWACGHPANPQGVILDRTGGNNVVRYNDLIGCETHWWNDFDYDLTSRGGVRLATGGEKHAVTAVPTFVAPAQGDFRLAPGSAGIDQGCVLPGLNDGFAGRAPDMGAFEAGQAGLDFPPRPHGLSVLPLRATAPAPPSAGKSSVTVQLVAPPSVGKSWRAESNSPWLSCTPAQGATTGEPTPVRIEIAADGREKPRYRGAVTFRTDRGCVRTVMIDAGSPPAGK